MPSAEARLADDLPAAIPLGVKSKDRQKVN